MNAPRTITLPTLDHGDVAMPEPSWCAGHADHRPDTHRVDLDHKGPEHLLRHHGEVLWKAFIGQAPFASRPEDRAVGLFVEQGSYGQTLGPAELYDLAATFETHADRLRELADQLAQILTGGGR